MWCSSIHHLTFDPDTTISKPLFIVEVVFDVQEHRREWFGGTIECCRSVIMGHRNTTLRTSTK